MWRGSTLAAEVETTLRWALDANLRLAFATDALTLHSLAIDSPDVTGTLVEAIVEGKVEVVGGAYATINGLLAGGETNIRNRIMGAVTFVRLACSPATTQWQRHFDVWPQQAQVLTACGIDGLVLIPGSTRSSPSTPLHEDAVSHLPGMDGRALAVITRSKTAGVAPSRVGDAIHAAKDSVAEGRSAIVATWVPTATNDQAVELRAMLAATLAAELRSDNTVAAIVEPRQIFAAAQARGGVQRGASPLSIDIDSAWHGEVLGVNGDRLLRGTARLERSILDVEALACLETFLGRHGAKSSYPHWELQEAWRGLLSAQHQEVRERQHAFVGIAIADMIRAQSLVDDARERLEATIARRAPSDKNGCVVVNCLGWERSVEIEGKPIVKVPAFGWLALPDVKQAAVEGSRNARLRLAPEDDELVISAAKLRIKLHRRRGVITQVFSEDFPQGMLDAKQELLAFEVRNDDGVERFEDSVEVRSDIHGVRIERHGKDGKLDCRLEVRENPSRIVVHVAAKELPRPGCRPDVGDDDYSDCSTGAYLRDAFSMKVVAKLGGAPTRIVDTPYHVGTIDPRKAQTLRYAGAGSKVEEKVLAPFTASSFVDVVEAQSGRGLLYIHDGGMGFTADRAGARAILSTWDIGGAWVDSFETSFALVPHGPMTHEQRARLAAEHRSPLRVLRGAHGDGQLPDRFSGVRLEGEHASITAFFREDVRVADLLCGDRSYDQEDDERGGPWALRIVEFDGVKTALRLVFPSQVELVTKGTPIGAVLCELDRDPVQRNTYLLELQPREIATVRFRYAR